MTVSVIIPCYNNSNELDRTVDEVITSLGPQLHEIILIDDASIDATWQRIMNLTSRYPNTIRGFRCEKNYGSYAAILVGFEQAQGDTIVVMAADGDDPPSLLAKLIGSLKSDTDLVQAVREGSRGSFVESIVSRVFYFLLKVVGLKNIPGGGSDFILVRKETIQAASQKSWYAGNTLFQLFQAANSVTRVEYQKGINGSSGWSFAKKSTLLIDTLKWAVLSSKADMISIPAVVETC